MSGRPDYDVGDVVVCVRMDSNPIMIGKVYRAKEFLPPDSDGDIGVRLFGVRPNTWRGAFAANRFRKIDAADEAFTRQMRAIKPAKVTA